MEAWLAAIWKRKCQMYSLGKWWWCERINLCICSYFSFLFFFWRGTCSCFHKSSCNAKSIWCTDRNGKSKEIYHQVYIDMSDISREIYRYIRYIGRNISTDYFFLNKHPSVGWFVRIDTNHYLFSNTQT